MMERQQTQWRWQHWQVGGLLFVLCRPWGLGCSHVTQELGFLHMLAKKAFCFAVCSCLVKQCLHIWLTLFIPATSNSNWKINLFLSPKIIIQNVFCVCSRCTHTFSVIHTIRQPLLSEYGKRNMKYRCSWIFKALLSWAWQWQTMININMLTTSLNVTQCKCCLVKSYLHMNVYIAIQRWCLYIEKNN